MDAFGQRLSAFKEVRVIDATIPYERYFPIDLSVSNPALTEIDADDSAAFEAYIHYFLAKNKAEVAYGGYAERRQLYNRSGLFSDGDTRRNIHIGIDLWVDAGTTVLAAAGGRVHSFNYNAGIGNYGPTIILEHELEKETFYTLYGHLSLESIAELDVGQQFAKGQQIGTVGTAEINGDYAPHLHFQIIRDLRDNFGDYPGVCSETSLESYSKNCPDPNILLKISAS